MSATPVMAAKEAQAEHRLAEQDMKEDRLFIIAEMQVNGATRREILDAIQGRWKLSRRMAQLYLKEAEERLVCEAAQENRLFYLKLSQLQRDKVMSIAVRYVSQPADQPMDPKVLYSLTALMTATARLLDSRDHTAAEINSLIAHGEKTVVTLAGPANALQLTAEAPSDLPRLATIQACGVIDAERTDAVSNDAPGAPCQLTLVGQSVLTAVPTRISAPPSTKRNGPEPSNPDETIPSPLVRAKALPGPAKPNGSNPRQGKEKGE